MVWVNIPDTDVDQDSPVTVALMTALRDNVQGMGQFNDGAPVPHAGWHPYNMVEIGDGNDGVYYDNAVDGNQGDIDTPLLEDGFEYAILMRNISGTSSNIRVSVQRSTDNNYFGAETVGNYSTSGNGWLFCYRARDIATDHAIHSGYAVRDNEVVVPLFENATPFAVDRIRFRLGASGSTTTRGGTLALYRRALL